MPDSPEVGMVSANGWWEKFHEEYDAAAADFTTELGLFYERHQKYLQSEQQAEASRPEYTDAEWNRVLAYFLAGLSEEFGLVQERGWTGRPQLVWTRPGSPGQASVVIHECNDATDDILETDVPELAGSEVELSVLIMYPDYPFPTGATNLAEATETWRGRVEAWLRVSPPRGSFLLVTISAYSWELPSSWKGFHWDRHTHRLRPEA